LFPRDRDFADYKTNYQYFDTDRNMYLQKLVYIGRQPIEPYWLINKQPKEDLTKRVIASLNLEYQIAAHLKFQARGSYDYAIKSYEQKFYAGGNTVNISTNGRWATKNILTSKLILTVSLPTTTVSVRLA
jgi:hypothetical protein